MKLFCGPWWKQPGRLLRTMSSSCRSSGCWPKLASEVPTPPDPRMAGRVSGDVIMGTIWEAFMGEQLDDDGRTRPAGEHIPGTWGLRTGPRAGMDYLGHETYGGQRGDIPRRFSIALFKIFVYLFLAAPGLCAVQVFSLVAARGGYSPVTVHGFLIAVAFLVAAHGLGCSGSVVVVHGLTCSIVCGIFLEQGSNPCLSHWQADS